MLKIIVFVFLLQVVCSFKPKKQVVAQVESIKEEHTEVKENILDFYDPKMGQEIQIPYIEAGHRNYESYKAYDSIVKRLLPFDSFKFGIFIHTDCRSTKAYNLILTQRLADSAAVFFVRKSNGRLNVKGFGMGESQLVNNCVCEGDTIIPCPESSHQENRRAILKIIGKQ